jgi:hypothetical protein
MLCGGEEAESAVFENTAGALREKTGASRAKAHADCVSCESINSSRTFGEAGEKE